MSAFAGHVALSGYSPRRLGSDAEFTFVAFIGRLCHLSLPTEVFYPRSKKERMLVQEAVVKHGEG